MTRRNASIRLFPFYAFMYQVVGLLMMGSTVCFGQRVQFADSTESVFFCWSHVVGRDKASSLRDGRERSSWCAHWVGCDSAGVFVVPSVYRWPVETSVFCRYIRGSVGVFVVPSVHSWFHRYIRGSVGLFVTHRYIRCLPVYPWFRRCIRGSVGFFVFRRFIRGSVGIFVRAFVVRPSARLCEEHARSRSTVWAN